MLNVYRSDRMERLVDALAEVLREPLPDPAAPEWIAVQSQGMRVWLGQQLAERFGVFANVRMPFPRGLVQLLLQGALGDRGLVSPAFDRDSLAWSIMAELPGLSGRPAFEPLASYLAEDPRGIRSYQLAARIAGAFDEYALYRHEMLLDWERRQPDDEWQPRLWNAVVARNAGADHAGHVIARFLEQARSGRIDPAALPSRVSLFGISSLPPMHVEVLAGLPAAIEVDLFLLSPSREYWAHIGKRVPRGASLEPDEIDLHLDDGHPLLSSMGLLGRDFQAVLESATDYHEPCDDMYEEPLSRRRSCLLNTLQSDILALRNRRVGADDHSALPAQIDDDDDSISVHSCHGPMREVEVLRDRLLALFDEEQLALEPHDVLVLTPDIETYAPFVEAVFGGAIPYSIIGRAVRRQAQVVDAFGVFLALVRGRICLQEVFDFLAAEPVRDRFGMSAEDVERAQAWAVEVGIRWGIDRDHRGRFGQPELSENTWRFGLDRLLLGYAVPDDQQLLFDGVVPFAEIEGEATGVLGRFADFCEELFTQLEELDRELRLPEWTVRLGTALERLFDSSDDRAQEHHQIREWLADAADASERSGFTEPVDFEIVRMMLEEEFSGAQWRHVRPSGAVTVSDILPLRGIPARVVCLLGMNDKEFPRTGHPQSFDLMAEHPKIGDRSLRNDDRYLFLEAMLAARERLVITYVGQDIQSNRRLPPSVVVSELLDAIDDGFYWSASADLGTDARERLIVSHPLQPFSRRYFEPAPGRDELLFTYASDYLPGVEAIASGRTVRAQFFDPEHPLSLDADDVAQLRLDDLSRFFAMPCEYLLQRRLGIYLERGGDDAALDREPFSLGSLEMYVVGASLLDSALAGRDLTDYYPVERGRGRLPLGVQGVRVYERLATEVVPLTTEIDDARAAGPFEPLALDVALDTPFGETRLVGTLDGITKSARVQHSFGKNKAKRLLDTWIRHLALNSVAPGSHAQRTIWIGRGNKKGVTRVVFEPFDEGARRLLAQLVELYWVGQQRPLEFFPNTALAYAYKMYQSADDPNQTAVERQAVVNAGRAWDTTRLRGGGRIPGESENPAVTRFFGERRPFEERGGPSRFKELARMVYDPLLARLEKPTQASS